MPWENKAEIERLQRRLLREQTLRKEFEQMWDNERKEVRRLKMKIARLGDGKMGRPHHDETDEVKEPNGT